MQLDTSSEPWLIQREAEFVDGNAGVRITEIYDLAHPRCPVVVVDPPSHDHMWTRWVFMGALEFHELFGRWH
jgi:hypothetical protein